MSGGRPGADGMGAARIRRLAGLVGVALLLAACASPTPTVPASPSSAASGSPSPAATATPSPSPSGPIAWSLVGPSLNDCRVSAAIRRESGQLLAICQDGNLRPQLLTSWNGTVWQVDQPVGLDPSAPSRVTVVTALTESPTGELLAVGADALGDMSSGDAATWTSTDGITWQRAVTTRSLRDAEMVAVTSTPFGFLAVGADGFPGAGVQMPGLRGGLMWRSADGISWRRIAAPASFDRRALEGVTVDAGRYLAWGDAAPPGTGAVWTSADGLAWTAAVGPADAPWGPIGAVVATTGTYVAVGARWLVTASEADVRAGMWSSPNGRRWTDRTDADATGDAAYRDVAWTGERLVAVGDGGQVSWSLDGGSSWVRLPNDVIPQTARLDRVVPLPGGIVVFGTIPGAEADTAAIWSGLYPQVPLQ